MNVIGAWKKRMSSRLKKKNVKPLEKNEKLRLNKTNVELTKRTSRLKKRMLKLKNECQCWIKGVLNLKNEGRM